MAKEQANIAKVYLDSESSSVYGLMVTGMEVTNTWDQSEPILVNGWDHDDDDDDEGGDDDGGEWHQGPKRTYSC